MTSATMAFRYGVDSGCLDGSSSPRWHVSSNDAFPVENREVEENDVAAFGETSVADARESVATLAPDLSTADMPLWLIERITELFKLRTISASWESTGAAAPNVKAIENAADVLFRCVNSDFVPDQVTPSTDEGVCLSSRKGLTYVDVECFNSGEVLAAMASASTPTTIVDVDPENIDVVIRRLATFMRG